MNEVALVEVEGLVKEFPARSSGKRRVRLRAVDEVSIHVHRGEALALVGESGAGKTTLGLSVLRLLEPTAGMIRFDGIDVTRLDLGGVRRLRRRMQIVFQDPRASLHPDRTVERLVGEPLAVHGLAPGALRRERTTAVLERVGIPPERMNQRPGAFSGGQCQRIAIARALVVDPDFLVLDEPVSALDPPVRLCLLDLLAGLQQERGLALLFITHDLLAARRVAHRIAVMHFGRIVEVGGANDVCTAPRHPCTRALLAAVPRPDPTRRFTEPASDTAGSPLAGDQPSGCRFHPWCPVRLPRCSREAPRLVAAEGAGKADHLVACHLARDGRS